MKFMCVACKAGADRFYTKCPRCRAEYCFVNIHDVPPFIRNKITEKIENSEPEYKYKYTSKIVVYKPSGFEESGVKIISAKSDNMSVDVATGLFNDMVVEGSRLSPYILPRVGKIYKVKFIVKTVSELPESYCDINDSSNISWVIDVTEAVDFNEISIKEWTSSVLFYVDYSGELNLCDYSTCAYNDSIDVHTIDEIFYSSVLYYGYICEPSKRIRRGTLSPGFYLGEMVLKNGLDRPRVINVRKTNWEHAIKNSIYIEHFSDK